MSRRLAVLLLTCCGPLFPACGEGVDRRQASSTPTAASPPAVTPTFPKNGDYPATGAVTKINMQLPSVELDHDDIPGVMPPMRMEFFVSDKKLLSGLAVGDRVEFVLRYKDRTETIVAIKKAK